MVVASRLFLIFLSLLFISNFVSAQTLTKIDVDLKNLFKTTEVEKLENKEEILDFNEICHQKLETYLNSFGEQNKDRINACLMSLSPELEIEKLTKVLNQERLSRFTAREQIPLFAQFFKKVAMINNLNSMGLFRSLQSLLTIFHLKIKKSLNH